jgi:hypothetical protein
MNGFYNGDGVCLLRGTNWIFNSYSGLGKAMSQAVSRRHLSAEFRVRSQNSPCGICGEHTVALGLMSLPVLWCPCGIYGGHSGTRPDVSASASVSPVSIIPLMLHIFLHSYVALTGRTKGLKPGNLPKVSATARS